MLAAPRHSISQCENIEARKFYSMLTTLHQINRHAYTVSALFRITIDRTKDNAPCTSGATGRFLKHAENSCLHTHPFLPRLLQTGHAFDDLRRLGIGEGQAPVARIGLRRVEGAAGHVHHVVAHRDLQ